MEAEKRMKAADVLVVMGTRPEVIKLAPVVQALRAGGLRAPVLATAQHRSLLDQMLAAFDLHPDWDLDCMRPDQGLSQLVARALPALEDIVRDSGCRMVLAQGDTTTVFVAALAAFHARVPFGHVEAGLRSGDLAAPFPEEGNRRLASVLARFHFAPTAVARKALLAEGVPDGHIHLVGNTVIDALLGMAARPGLPWPQGLPPLAPGQRLVLVTLHRRENFGAPLERCCRALATFAAAHPEAVLAYPVHPNPHVSGPARALLGGLPNVHLLEPLDYPQMVAALRAAWLVVTDSGGLQEEAPALGRPVLVCREVTERPEAVAAGSVRLAGVDGATLLALAGRLWDDPAEYQAMAVPRFPFGDGHAGERIAEVLVPWLAGGSLR
jgi:UDP-N-acetylglucosamine 2-epimerase (non-hydrolysing)